MVFSDFIWYDCPYTGRNTGAYTVSYQGGPIDHFTHFPGPFAQSISESDYSSSRTAGMYLSHFRMLNNEFLNKDPDVVPEQAPLIILNSKSDVCMARNVK